MSDPTLANEPTSEDVDALAKALVSRMTWPSMHWRTQGLDYEAAVALARVAFKHGPHIIAGARMKEAAMKAALEGEAQR